MVLKQYTAGLRDTEFYGWEEEDSKMHQALERIYELTCTRVDKKSREICAIAMAALKITVPECYAPYPEHEDPYGIYCMDRWENCPDSCRWKNKC